MKRALERAPFYLTCGSAVAILFGPGVSEVLLALAFAALLISGQEIRFPPIKLPLFLYMAGTVISLLLSGAIREGTPQIRKFYLFLVLLLVYSAFRKISEARGLILVLAEVTALSALRSVFQFLQKWREAQALQQNFYDYYVGNRITGFVSHWMTLGGQEMMVLLLLASYLFFSHYGRWKAAGWIAAVIIAVSLVLGETRSIYLLGFPLGLLYLLWFWRRWMVIAVPAAALVAILLSPGWLKERAFSVVTPHGQADSNQVRVVARRTGFEMIRQHPWFGVGPEQVKDPHFFPYVPADIPRPLPPGWYGHLHNIYLQYAAERGIPTALALFWMIGKILYDFAIALRRTTAKDEARFILHGAIAVIIAILAEGFFEYNLGTTGILLPFLVVVGLGYVAREAQDVGVA